jgi:hypothetical protein
MTRYITREKAMTGMVALACAALLAGIMPANAVTEAVSAKTFLSNDLVRVTFSGGTDGAVTLTFAKLGNKPPVPYPRGAGLVVSGPGNVFSGDYSTVSQVSLRVTPQGAYEPDQVILFFSIAGDDAEWQYTLDGAAAAQDAIVVPLRLDAGWTFSMGGGNADLWNAWIKQVDEIGVRIIAGGPTAPEAYTISDFKLDDVGGVSLMPERVVAYFRAKYPGVVQSAADITAQMMADDGDNDGDGVKNYLEIWAGTAMDSANSVFAAKIVSVSDNVVTLEWPYATDVSYTVLRSTGLGGTFDVLDARVDSANPEATIVGSSMRYEDNSAKEGMAYFYKIVIE